MPRPNRVNPFGDLVATPARGTLMGNRGILHDRGGRIIKHHTHLAWIACVLEFKGRHRPMMTPGSWTELFFLDEATALAAGHRPCGECRRADYKRFKEAWAANSGVGAGDFQARDIDRMLHPERIHGRGVKRRKPTFHSTFGRIPDGVMFHRGEEHPTPMLKWNALAWAWSPDGYGEGPGITTGQSIEVLTPKSLVNAIRAGYVPMVHRSAHQLARR